MMTGFLIVAGMLLLVIGAEALVRGASQLAALAGISPLVIGLTVVAFGTSSPELAVSLQSAFSGASDVAVGNVVGSNTLNVLLILGLCAAITPLQVDSQVVRLDVPVMIVASAMLMVMAWNGMLSRFEGTICFGALLIYIALLMKIATAEGKVRKEEMQRDALDSSEIDQDNKGFSIVGVLINVLLVAVGLALLIGGCRMFVGGAVELARLLGMSELMIGLTVVSIGTSLPELLTSLVASLRGRRDMAVGGIIGSNIFNIWSVLGLTAIVAPGGVSVSREAIAFDIPLTLVIAILCIPICWSGFVISRREGIAMIVAYFAYTVYLCWRG